jgi:hypothetical protein
VHVSASQHSTRITAEWFRKRIRRLKKDRAFRRGVDTIIALRTGVWREEYWREQDWKKEDCETEETHLRDALTHFACLTVSPHQGRPAILERGWASKTGKAWKALRDFPRQLENMAEEVARINRGDPLFFARRCRNDLERRDLETLRRICRQLPDMMRSYAAALRERNTAVTTASPRNGRFVALLSLSGVVNTLTGAYHDKDIAALLDAAATALGEKAQFDALSIAQTRYRYRQRRAQT